MLLVGRHEGHLAVECWVFVCWWWRYDWNFARLIAPVVTTSSIIFSSNKVQTGDIQGPAYLVCPENWPLNERRPVDVAVQMLRMRHDRWQPAQCIGTCPTSRLWSCHGNRLSTTTAVSLDMSSSGGKTARPTGCIAATPGTAASLHCTILPCYGMRRICLSVPFWLQSAQRRCYYQAQDLTIWRSSTERTEYRLFFLWISLQHAMLGTWWLKWWSAEVGAPIWGTNNPTE